MFTRSCRNCIYFKPNIYYPYIGLCTVKEESGAVVEERVEVCDRYRQATLEELREILRREGWLYCLNCRKTITDEEELEEHWRKHVVVKGLVIDESVAEEAPVGD